MIDYIGKRYTKLSVQQWLFIGILDVASLKRSIKMRWKLN